MAETQESISISTAKLKPIKCKGRVIRTLNFTAEEKEALQALCRERVLAWCDGRVVFLNREHCSDLDVGRRVSVKNQRIRKKKDLAKGVKLEVEIDGTSHVLDCILTGGRSLGIYCTRCGGEEKMFGIELVIDDGEKILDTSDFRK